MNTDEEPGGGVAGPAVAVVASGAMRF